ncbi:MAG TPA: hypothetical protein VEW65_16305 [Chryseolinea sp.]|nr:hypothetical protein [Chryseolinea sp.]
MIKIPVVSASGGENTFIEWMIIDSGPAEDSSDGIGSKNFF